jgi:predicted amidophosphoribosyltransferase
VDALEGDWEHRGTLHYRLCPRCFRAVPANSSERYCINDGSWLLEHCPLCSAPITNPYARYCAGCGLEFSKALSETPNHESQEVSE